MLLKNENSFLPLHKDSIQTIAVIGPNANAVQLGGYSGSPYINVSTLQGIADKLGIDISIGTIEAENYSNQYGVRTEASTDGGTNIGFIEHGDYTVYDSVDFEDGKLKLDLRVASNTAGGFVEAVLDNLNGQSLGKFTIPGTGGWQTWTTLTVDITNVTGKHKVYLKYSGGGGYLFNINWFRFYNTDDIDPTAGGGVIKYASGCSVTGPKDQPEFDKALAFAKNSDIAVVVCGTDLSVSDEGNDRTSLNLPGVQEQLLKEVYRANPNTVLVLVNGVQLAVNWAQDSIPAILCAWYSGQSQGTAIADVLFGGYNPGGKLTTTWYKSTSDLPPINDYDIKNNRTYMYFEGGPLYPFGHGLSYTTFEYSNLSISSQSLDPDDSVMISVHVKNTGDIEGDEVVQLYAHVNNSLLKRPVKELRGFERINLQSGETGTVKLYLHHSDLKYYDVISKTYKVEGADVDIMIGSSSDDIRLKARVTVAEAVIKGTYRQDPFKPFEAEHLEGKSKPVTFVSDNQGGLSIQLKGNNSSALYKNFDFQQVAKRFNASVATIGSNISLSIVLDSLTGTEVGSLALNTTGDINSYEVQSCELSNISGVRDVYIIFHGDAPSFCNIDWFDFRENVTGIENKLKQAKGYDCSLYPNPSGSNFTLKYHLPDRSDIHIEIYSLQGVSMGSFNQKGQGSGTHSIEFDNNNLNLISGSYILNFNSETYNSSFILNITERGF